jgi:hypothetical protein
MSTRVSLLYFKLDDDGEVHIFQEGGTDDVWMEQLSRLCTAREWNRALAEARKAEEAGGDTA